MISAKIVVRNSRQLSKVIDKLYAVSKMPFEVVIKDHDPKRTRDQNDLMWAICRAVAKETGHTAEEIKLRACYQLLGVEVFEVEGAIWAQPKSTSNLSKKEFSDFVDQLYAWAITNYQVSLED